MSSGGISVCRLRGFGLRSPSRDISAPPKWIFPARGSSGGAAEMSKAGDTFLNPFVGTGSTTIAAIRTGRNSIWNEIEPEYSKLARGRILRELNHSRLFAAQNAVLL